MTSSPHFFSGIVEERNVSTRENHLTREWRDEVVRERNFSLTATFRISHVGWFSRMVVFCSLYCPWGKMGTTRSLGSNHFLPLDKKWKVSSLKSKENVYCHGFLLATSVLWFSAVYTTYIYVQKSWCELIIQLGGLNLDCYSCTCNNPFELVIICD